MKFHYRGPLTNEDEILDRLLHPPSMIAVDTETVSLKDRTMLGFGIATSPNEAYYIPIWPEPSEVLRAAYGLIHNPAITKLGHNYTFDISVLRQFAVSRGWPLPDVVNIHDTGIMANVMAFEPDLHTLGLKYGDLKLFTIQDLLEGAREQTGKKQVNMTDVDSELVALKCMNDVRTTYRLFEVLSAQLTPRTLDCYQVDRELLGVLKTIERKGLKINHDVVQQKYLEYSDRCGLYEEWAEDQGFSISSPAQVGMFLANSGIVLPATASGRQLATSDDILSKFAHNPLVGEVLTYRKYAKLLSTYVEPYLNADRFFTHFRLDLATGRLASGGEDCPDHVCGNGQNIPPDMRDIFAPDNGEFEWADMSQLEMRVFAHLSQDETLLDAYQNDKSIHEITFRSIYPQLEFNKNIPEYVKAKTFNFAMIFDANDNTLSAQCGITKAQAKQWKATWFDTYPGAYRWMKSIQDTNTTFEETIFGRRMRIPNDYERGRGHANKCRINYPVQGSGADLNKRAVLKLYKGGYTNDLRLQVHDEVLNDGLFDFPHELVSRIHPEIFVPWEVKQGKVWT